MGCSGGSSDEVLSDHDDLGDHDVTDDLTDDAPTDVDTCPFTDCPGGCTDTNLDPASCGACGYACDQGLACVAGTCTLVCPLGKTPCDGTCVDTTSDDAHCGACGVSCGAGRCSASACSAECPPSSIDCGGTCVEPALDPEHCGACSIACSGGQDCQQGRCCTPSVDCDMLPLVVLPVITIADWRGEIALDDDNEETDKPTAVLAAYIDDKRAETPGTLVLATGLFGMPSRVSLVRPSSAIEVMNELALDAAGLTGRDLARGTDFIAALSGETDFPLVAPADTAILEDVPEARAPFVILPAMGHQVAVIDVTQASGDALELATMALFSRSEAEANGADFFVLLTDLETVKVPGPGRASGPLYVLAKAVRGFELIVGQATRADMYGVSINGQLVVQNHNRGRARRRLSRPRHGSAAHEHRQRRRPANDRDRRHGRGSVSIRAGDTSHPGDRHGRPRRRRGS